MTLVYVFLLLIAMFAIYIHYMALLNTVECSVHLNGPSQRSAVKYFRIIDRC